MNCYLTFQFLEDLRSADDPRFVRRVLQQLFDSSGEFKRGQNDHRYHGIDDAWIRYVSKGRTGYRLIYIQKNDSVYIYRAGVHSVEDNLTAPQRLDLAVPVVSMDLRQTAQSDQARREERWLDSGAFLRSTQEIFLKKVFHGLSHVGHHEIVLVAPFVSEETVARSAPLGRFLDRAIEEGTNVWLVTRPPDPAKLDFFRALEERDFGVYFYKTLHAKLYLFEVNPSTLGEFNRDLTRTAIIGSANLTEMGLALAGELSNEELCYRLPDAKFEEARLYAHWLIHHSEDVAAYRLRSTRRF